MTKKDYEKFAHAMAITRPSTSYGYRAYELWLELREYFAVIFAEDNPNFDKERFYKATEIG